MGIEIRGKDEEKMAKTKHWKESTASFLLTVIPGVTQLIQRKLTEQIKEEPKVLPSIYKKSHTGYLPLTERSAEELRVELQGVAIRIEEVEKLNDATVRIADMLTKGEIKTIVENYTNPKKLILTNFLAGLSRGLGLTLGTAVVLSILVVILSKFLTLPIIGDYVKDILTYIKAHQ